MPLIHATRAPTQGTARLAGIPHGDTYLLTLSCTVTCSRPWWYVATCSGFDVSAYFLFGFRSSLRWHCASFFSPVSSPRWNLTTPSFPEPFPCCTVDLSFTEVTSRRVNYFFRRLPLIKDNSLADTLERTAELKVPRVVL